MCVAYVFILTGDFGCSQKLNWDDEAEIISPTNRSDITGTIAYRSPELLKGCPPSTKADIYAYGIVLWQMISGKHPYSGKVRQVRQTRAKLFLFLGCNCFCVMTSVEP